MTDEAMSPLRRRMGKLANSIERDRAHRDWSSAQRGRRTLERAAKDARRKIGV